MDLGKTIKSKRQEAGLSQKELASQLGITTAALWKIENNKTVPKLGTIKRICATLKLPLAYVFGAAMELSDYICP